MEVIPAMHCIYVYWHWTENVVFSISHTYSSHRAFNNDFTDFKNIEELKHKMTEGQVKDMFERMWMEKQKKESVSVYELRAQNVTLIGR